MKAAEIAQITSGELKAPIAFDAKTNFSQATSLKNADSLSVSFLTSRKFLKEFESSSAGLTFIPKDMPFSEEKAVIVVENPFLAFLEILERFNPIEEINAIELNDPIAPSAEISQSTKIFPNVYIGSGSKTGENVIIYPGTFIGRNVTIGNNVTLHSNVSVYHNTVIGNNVIVHAGTVIGSDGFGYVPLPDGSRKKIPQLGNVVIEDDVEIGSNSSIDRAVFDSTLIKRGVKIDNLVQIAHNVVVDEHSVLCSQSGISGSSTLGKFVILAGQVGIADHVEIADKVIITAKSGVPSSIKEAGVYSGIPVMPNKLWLRVQGGLKKLPELIRKLR